MTPATSGVRPISCLRATVTTHRENTGDGAHSWRVVKRATRFNAVPLCSFVSGTLADSSCTSQDRVVTNGLTTHHNSSRVTTARGLDTDPQIANVDTQKLEVALDPHCCSNSASQLVARPPQNIACDGLLCTGMDSSAEREKVGCFFLPPWSDCPLRPSSTGGRTHVASQSACVCVSRFCASDAHDFFVECFMDCRRIMRRRRASWARVLQHNTSVRKFFVLGALVPAVLLGTWWLRPCR